MGEAPDKPARRYREVGVLAEGGMAVIAQGVAEDGASVVVKRVRAPFCFDAGYLRLFDDEGAVHAALDHPCIVRLLDRGQDDAGPFLVFEHVDGTDLGVILEAAHTAGRGLEVEDVLAVAVPLFQALAAAHAAKGGDGACLCVVHRDVSPGNVLIGTDGCVKLADFGVAASTLKSEATVAGEMKGKYAYMAPEQTRSERVGPAADLFAGGIVLWECLAGRRLFDGPTDADIVQAVRQQEAARLDTLRSDLPAALVELVAQLLQKEPAARPASAADVEERLRAIALERGIDEGLARHAARLARTAPRREATPRELDSRRRTHRVLGPDAGAVTVRPSSGSRARLFVGAGVLLAASAAIAVMAVRDRGVTAEPLPDQPAAPLPAPAPAALVPVEVGSAPRGAGSAGPDAVVLAPPTPPPGPLTSAPIEKRRPPVGAAGDGTTARPRPAIAAAVTAVAAAAPNPEEVGFGRLSLLSEPWASVTIDGVLVAKETPLRNFLIRAGKHVVVLENPVIGASQTLEVEVAKDADVRRFVKLSP
ncbi:MAG: serine/threonine protein kinase [Deltaproteobacteria bacterium]|nr:serine/threonine protein kinase [Deltaproteobacteria bacterium]